jgi:hypothetical protein
MEAIRRSRANGSIIQRFASITYSLYKMISLYGESLSLPLVIWTPITIGIFTYLRYHFNICSLENSTCGIINSLVDSIAAFFQIPRSETNYDVIERILSAPILGSAFIAVRRKFERKK